MKTIRLNLGAGFDHRAGFINADIDPATKPDQIIDVSQVLPYKTGSVSEVLLNDVLEHLTRQDGERLIREISRVLKPNGTFSLRVPNLHQITRQFASDPAVMMEFAYGTTAKNGLWGAHKYGYTPATLERILKIHGFENIAVRTETTNFVATCRKSTTSPLKPNILVIEQAPDWGGAEEWMRTLVTGWQKQKLTVTGITDLPQLKSAWQKVGAKVIHLPFILDFIGNYKGLIKSILLFPYAVFWYSRVLKIAKRTGVNCVVASGFSEKLLVTVLCRKIGLPIVWFEYGPLTTVFRRNWYLPKILYRLVRSIPEAVITISENSKQSLITDARVSLAKIHVISPGTTMPQSIPPLPKIPVIGHLSRLAPEKGQRLLLEAFALLHRKMPTVKLIIAGRGPDSDYLQSLAQKLNLGNNVSFRGFIQDKLAFFKSISVFAFPSLWPMEGFGLVLAEAMAYGRPVVVVDNGPAKEVIGDSGGIITPADPKSLAKGLHAMLDSQLSREGREAAAYANRHYNATIQVNLVTKVISDVVKLYS